MCFILTMWYVNEELYDEFYKYACSFILTMWYVNGLNVDTKTAGTVSFILTMWYVNVFYLPFIFPSFLVLY